MTTTISTTAARVRVQIDAAVDLANGADDVLALVDRAIAEDKPDLAAALHALSWRMRATAHRFIWFIEDGLPTPKTPRTGAGS